MGSSFFRHLLIVFAFVTLAACESDEERAARHFDSGIELYEAGDVARAMVEFRNVLRLDEHHKDARLLVARIALQNGNVQNSMQNYLRLVEQDPNILEGRIAVAREAAFRQAWEEAERHGRAARDLAPDNAEVRAINLVLDYREAIESEDDEARSSLASQAEALLGELPESRILRNLLIDARAWQGTPREAISYVDEVLELEPSHRPYHTMRLSLLVELGDEPGIEAQLRRMVETFPSDLEAKATLVAFLVDTDQIDKAETFFRSFASPDDSDIGAYVGFIQFLARHRGNDAAIAELEATAMSSARPFELRSMLAGMRFDQGDSDTAIGEMRALLADGPPALIRDDLEIAFAQMLLATGQRQEAEGLIEAIVERSPEHQPALKLKAALYIEDEEFDLAISSLRRTLELVPEDVEAMQLIATAYTMTGSHGLARDTLALAATSSNYAPGPTFRYADLLVTEERYRAAESVLVSALRVFPENLGFLERLGRVYLLENDFTRAAGVVTRLERLDAPEAAPIAERLRLGLLAGQDRTEDLIAMLEQLAGEADASSDDKTLLIRGLLASGDVDGALRAAREAAETDPGDADARVTFAATLAATGDVAGGLAEYEAMRQDGLDSARVRRLIVMAKLRLQDFDAARAAVIDGTEAFPDDPDMLWMYASLLEQESDIDGAIAVYEKLYEQNPLSLVVTNNLASLLATYRFDDTGAVERAFNIARRLRDTDVPAFQDTYGWISHLRGNTAEALQYLRPAAEALRNDPIVQFHLGMALVAAGETEEARERLEGALEVAGPDDPRPQFDIARSTIESLAAGGTEGAPREN